MSNYNQQSTYTFYSRKYVIGSSINIPQQQNREPQEQRGNRKNKSIQSTETPMARH